MSVITREWTDVRTELGDAADRFIRLLAAVSEPARRAIGTWTIAETAAHVTIVGALDDYCLTGGDLPPHLEHLADLEDQLRSAKVADVASLNQVALERDQERDLGALSERVRDLVAHALAVTDQSDGSRVVSWLGDVPMAELGVLSHLLLELEVHGHDIAGAAGLPWAISPRSAVLGFELFLLGLIRGGGHRLFHEASGDNTFRCEFRAEGAGPIVLDFRDGTLIVDEPGEPVDVRLSGDPVALMSVMFRRISPVGPLVRRQLSMSGRRPWRIRRMMRVLQVP